MQGKFEDETEAKMMTSVVSYPKRCALWGDARYRGNCDGTLFKNLILRYGARRVADPMMGSGTTRDVVAWLNKHRGTNIMYWGRDLREGFDLYSHDLPGSFDFVWIHPPYWNIIRYSDHPADLSNREDYQGFLRALWVCLRRCHDALVPGGRLVILIGDVRRKGVYFPLVRDVLNLEGHLGELTSIIIKAQHNCRSDSVRYGPMADVPIKHEYCLVFRRLGRKVSSAAA